MSIEYHRNMLSDKPRNDAFYKALQALVKKGKTDIADIGCGSGIMGFLASRLGARNVYMYEHGPVIELARKLAELNKIENLHFIEAHSAAVEDAPEVDVIVTETLGNYAFEEQTIETIEDAKRFLKPGGSIIPYRVTHFVSPVVSDRFFKEMCVWDDVGFNIDYSPAKELSLNNIYVRTFDKEDLLDHARAAQAWDNVDFRENDNHSNRSGKVAWMADTDFTLYGYAIWWTADLAEGVDLSTGPLSPKTHWEQLYFPVVNPISIVKGDRLAVTISSSTTFEEGTVVTWDTEVTTASGKKINQSQDLSKGYLG